MRLTFEAGTLVLPEAPEQDLSFLPDVVWDARVGLHRAPACAYAGVRSALAGAGLPFTDEIEAGDGPSALHGFELPALRPYQEAALSAWRHSGRRGVVVLPTGSGKTRVALAAIARTRRRTLCLVPTRVLVQQWRAELEPLYAGSIGTWADGIKDLQPVTIATFEGAYRAMPELGRHFDLLVVDEVHHFGTGLRDEALEMCVAPFRLGLTATPPSPLALFRLGSLVGDVVYELGIADLAGTFLAEFDLYIVRVGLSPAERRAYTGERRVFSEAYRRFSKARPGAPWHEFVISAAQSPEGRDALAAWHRSRRLLALTQSKLRLVGDLLERHAANKTLVFTSDNASAYAIARQHLIAPITCEIGRKEREQVLSAFRRGELRALVSARVLNEGVDVPDADVAIVVGGSRGEREHVQRVGRLLRPRPGKRATVYELVTIQSAETQSSRERRSSLVAAHVARG